MAKPSTYQAGPSTTAGGKRYKAGNTPGFIEVKEVKPDPQQLRQTLFMEAFKLATMPRHRYSERTSAAFWGAVASIIPAIEGAIDLFKTPPEHVGMSLVKMAIFLICLVIWLEGIFTSAEQTAEEYLNELYKLPAPTKSWWDIRRHFS